MRPTRRVVGSVGLQVLGAAASFATGIVIALAEGPEAQGRYGLVRSAADLLLALLLFGLPQGIVFALNQRGASAAVLDRLGGHYVAAWALIGAVACAVVALWPSLSPEWLSGGWGVAALLLGTLGWLHIGLTRVFVLCRGSAMNFAWMSVLPALTLFAAVAAMLPAHRHDFESAIAASGLASALLGVVVLRSLKRDAGWSAGLTPDRGELLRSGLQAFAQPCALALQPWLSFWLLRQAGAPVAEVGLFVLATYVVQAFALPAGFVAPLLLARVSRAEAAGRSYAVRRPLRDASLAAAVAALPLAALMPWAVPGLFGAAYEPAVGACLWLAASAPALIANRLGVAVLLGRGHFRAATLHGLARMALVALCVWPALRVAGVHPATAAAAAWCAVEYICAALLWLEARKLKQGDPPR